MRLHLVDGTFELFRAHYSKRPAQPLKATRGMAQSLLVLLANPAEQVTHLAVAFDNPIRSFRNDLFADYKSDEGVPPELRAQFDAAEETTRAIGAVVWSMREFEADDALATAAARFGGQVDQVRILTPDKDLGQCLEADHIVQVDVIRKRVVNEQALLDRRGVKPESIPDFLALTGDDADGIPGLPGFGERTASALLARFGHLENVPLDARHWPEAVRGADRLAHVLRERLADVFLYRELATLRRDVPLRESLEDLRYRGPDERRVRELLALEAPATTSPAPTFRS
ncbi:MAG: flap endonuclease [Deltaproteobacteria bacterium 13_1_20CM_2_69_21]|nr:MAG: flap endonuclease [Deltaproteobacteria bacterium 13_1_40CM_4_68_19]OLD06485.1 MAG: flap endonuclease [Deltaproteobacteria bacterium 13_1_40CM_3_69_14]OLE63548.1 MAG: flap endonuclease [Deltaproteobacteria bacterium 13_1_20CM_2_69_21]HMC33829.1 5'-3' exonuclease H3TH domain-containing protein [Myxococcales bacterium]